MSQTVNIKHASVTVIGAEACSVLQQFVAKQTEVDTGSAVDFQAADLELRSSQSGLVLIWNKEQSSPLKFQLDFEKKARQLRSFPAPKQGAFNQALGKKTKHVIDATGGWGGDALLMCLQGYQVTVIERLPLMAALLDDAFKRLAASDWATYNHVCAPIVVCDDAAEVLAARALKADCVYLDPMFPSKRKKSASTNKNMQLLQWLAGPDADAGELARVAMSHYARLAVKRPDYAEPLMQPVDARFSSKLVHYDVYLKAERLV